MGRGRGAAAAGLPLLVLAALTLLVDAAPAADAHVAPITARLVVWRSAAQGSVTIVEPNPGNEGSWGYDPSTTSVPVGTTVTWTNAGRAIHSVTADHASADQFSSPNLSSGQVFQRTFTRPGTFTYHCREHPWMRGTVTVR